MLCALPLTVLDSPAYSHRNVLLDNGKRPRGNGGPDLCSIMLAFRHRSAIAPAPMEDPARAGCCTTAEMNPPKALPACKPPKALAALLDKLEQTAAQTLATYSPTHLKSSPPMRVKQALSPISQAGRRQQQQLRLPGHVQQDVKALIMAFIKQQHEKTGSQHENWKPYRTSKSPILLQDVPAVDASELQQALQGGALPPVKPSTLATCQGVAREAAARGAFAGGSGAQAAQGW